MTKKACDSNSTSEDEKVTKNGTGKNDGTRDRRKPKRNESTLSRFSSIFGGHGRNLTEVLVEEFRLNDRFSGEFFYPHPYFTQTMIHPEPFILPRNRRNTHFYN